MNRAIVRALIITVVAGFLTACGLGAMAVESISDIGATPASRKQKLTKDLKRFHNGLYWGQAGVVLGYVVDDKRDEFKRDMILSKKREKIVDHEIELVDFSDDARSAEVDVTVKYYEVPYYIVKSRLEREEWQFSMKEGWKIASRKILPDS
ncbi:MAG: hypothetical protein D6719_09300 [Candidatus Dadabacteria bacterium]|nr:MAG: hypothetical protein D6719_09300 [Candidatus Dadabacteria bacterium]